MDTIDISRAQTIDGWMSDAELLWLAEQAQSHKIIAEIGSYLGRSTRALADHTPGIVYAIDDWYGPRDVDWLTPEDRETVYARFLSRKGNNVIPVNADHAVAKIPEYPDMVFIDGDHEYENVLRDIQYWQTQIVRGGLLCGHDAYKEGVDRAVRETFGRVQIAPETTIWYEYV